MDPGAALRIAVFALALGDYAVFAWGAFWFFTRPHEPGRRFRLLKAAALVSNLSELACLATWPQPTRSWWGAGLAAYAASLALFLWALRTHRERPLSLMYSEDVPQRLVTWGPYRLVRHPFYASYLLAYVAGFVATGAWPLLLAIGTMALIYTEGALGEERKFDNSPLRASYQRYRAMAGLFWPRLRGISD